MSAPPALSHVVGIAGGTGSGKSWLAKYIKSELGERAVCLLQDWYYRDQSAARGAEELALNFDHPDAIETGMFIEHLDALRSGHAVRTPRYDFATHSRLPRTVPTQSAPVVVVEGIFVLQEKEIVRRLDNSVFVDTPDDVRLARRLERDATERFIPAAETLRLYQTFVRPMHEEFVQPSAANARHVWKSLTDLDFPRRFVREIREGSAS
jgi:uridine kinase